MQCVPVSMPKLHRNAFGSIREDFDAYCLHASENTLSARENGSRLEQAKVFADELSITMEISGHFRLARRVRR